MVGGVVCEECRYAIYHDVFFDVCAKVEIFLPLILRDTSCSMPYISIYIVLYVNRRDHDV